MARCILGRGLAVAPPIQGSGASGFGLRGGLRGREMDDRRASESPGAPMPNAII